jgi:uracil-DNA glycosylase
MTQPSLLPEPEPDREEPRERLDIEPDYEPEPEPDASPSASVLAAGATTLPELREAAAGCRACDLWRDATQTVFGEGPGEVAAEGPAERAPAGGRDEAEAVERIALVFIGEQPGDREDIEGRPFVGPAGAMFDRALADAGIDRTTTYVTNTVKHFKWTPQPTRGAGFRGTGKRRIHQKPNAEEIAACRPWLDAELTLLRPTLVVCLGATAAQALLGRSFRVTKQRGQVIDGPGGLRYMATVHPSSILRTEDDRRDAAYADFVDDLRTAAAML